MLSIGVGELLLLLVICLVPALALGGLVAVLVATQRKGKLGINVAAANVCGACGAGLPALRRPKNLRQMLWGGWTCPSCGAELDKWARPLPPKG